MKILLVKLLSAISIFALIATACGEDGNDAAGEQTAGQVTIAEGTVLDLDNCPDDWDPSEGVTDSQIRLGTSLPQSGQLAAFGTIATGMQYYFDYVNATKPINGKEIILIAKDDAYEAGRTVANVEEMLDTDNVLGFVGVIGTPNNFAIRPITDEACVPQLLNLLSLIHI